MEGQEGLEFIYLTEGKRLDNTARSSLYLFSKQNK